MKLKGNIKLFLKSHPMIYKTLVNCYNLKNKLLYYFKKPNLIYKRIDHMEKLRLVSPFSNNESNIFFGYYDRSPWDYSQKYILYLSVPLIQHHPNMENRGKIGVLNSKNNNKKILCKTKAWNWQQGSMLKWLKNDNNDPLFVYNDYRSEKYISVIRHVNEGIKNIIPFPIYTIDYKSKKALSLNFERLQILRPGYGYQPRNYSLKDYCPSNDGIYSINLENNKRNLILSLKELNRDLNLENSYHWVNHLKFNPSATRVAFFHRYKLNGKRKSRLFTMNPDGSDKYCLVNKGVASHFTWKNDDELLSWAKLPHKGDEFHYYLFEDKTTNTKIIGEKDFCQDGHPSFSPSGRWLLTDTYPDAGGWKSLILYDMKKKKRYDLGKFYTPVKFNKYYNILGSDNEKETIKSDLHPRWSRDDNKICFDSVHQGKRKMYIMDVDSIT